MPIVTSDFDGVPRPRGAAYDIGAYEYSTVTTWYVDNTNTPPGTGTAGDPYSSIQNAFNNVSLAAGDIIKIRSGSGTYDENAKPPIGKSGALGNPITVTLDAGSTAVLRYTGNGAQAAAIQLEDVDYWTITGLPFLGTGVFTSKYAIWVRANTVNVTGNSITNNTITNWGGSVAQNVVASAAIAVHGRSTAAFHPINTTVQGNTITGCRTKGIEDSFKTVGTTIDSNTITGMVEGRVASATSSVNEIGITTGSDSVNCVISNNSIHDHQAFSAATMTNQGFATWAGIWPDAGSSNLIISGNTVYNIGQAKVTTTNPLGTGWQAIGIFVEARINNSTVQQNIVYNIGTEGIRNGSSSHSNDANAFLSNTVFNINQGTGGGAGSVGKGFVAYNGSNISFVDNIVHNASQAQIYFTSTASGLLQGTIDYNDYFDLQGGAKVGAWNSGNVQPLSGWQQSSSRDVHSLNANPLFVSVTLGTEDFHLQNGSPCIGTGLSGVNMGAYPSQVSITPVISNVATSLISLNSFKVTWTTDVNSNSQVDYGLTSSYGSSTILDSSMVMSHSVTIIGLTKYSLYHFRVKSAAGGGSTTNSSDFTVITTLPPPTSVTIT